MADALNRHLASPAPAACGASSILAALATLAAALCVLAAPSPAIAADALRDPMRPPASASAPAGDAAAPTDAAAADAPDVLPRLQSIRRPAAGGTPRALFGDTWVAVGGRVGDWRVRDIRQDTVTLQSTREPREVQRVSLHQLEIRRTPGSP